METYAKPIQTSIASQKKEVVIFIVDDDPMYRKALEHRLGKNSAYTIYSYGTGEDCVKSINTLTPNIVILDYRLNDSNPDDMNGVQVLKRIKDMRPSVEVIMLSSQDSIDVAMDTLKNGAVDYITKGDTAFIKIQHIINLISGGMEVLENIDKKNNLSKKINVIILVILILLFLINKIFWEGSE